MNAFADCNVNPVALGGQETMVFAPERIRVNSTNLNSSPLWSSNLPAPSIVNGRYNVTNSIADAMRFYRLCQ